MNISFWGDRNSAGFGTALFFYPLYESNRYENEIVLNLDSFSFFSQYESWNLVT
jgi:hypothetical protein